MKTKRISYVFLFVLLISLTGCPPSSHPTDTAAKIIVPGTEVYLTAQDTLIALHDAGVPAIVNNWHQISIDRNAASKAYGVAWQAWIALSASETSDNQQAFTKALLDLDVKVQELLKYLQVPQEPQTQP